MLDLTKTLPDWEFVGGSEQSRSFQFTQTDGEEYNIDNGIAYFSVREYVNDGAPLMSKQFEFSTSSNGSYCVATITLDSADTKNLDGAYIYQLSLKDGNGTVAIPGQGRMFVRGNIDPDVLA